MHSTQLLGKKYHATAATLGAILQSWAQFRDRDSVGSEIMTVGGVISLAENVWSVGETVVKRGNWRWERKTEKFWAQ